MDNGNPNPTVESEKPSIFSEVLEIVSDHVELAGLEMDYEWEHAGTRLAALGAAALLFLTAFILLQVTLVFLLTLTGLPIWAACLILAGVYIIVGIGLAFQFGRRDPLGGRPFEASRREFKQTLLWMRNLFS